MRPFVIDSKITDRSVESFKLYLKDINEIDYLTVEEEVDFGKKAFAGDDKAINELVTRNLRFVVSVAKQYVSSTNSLEDLVNEGNYGLMLAAKKYNPNKFQEKFISYAVWWVRKTIMEYIGNDGSFIRLPANKSNNLSKIRKLVSKQEQIEGRFIDFSEISERLSELSSDEINILNTLSNHSMDSLDREVSHTTEGSTCLGEMMIDDTFKPTDYLVSEADLKKSILQLLTKLKPRDKQIMIDLYGLNGNVPLTLKEVADKLNITREMIRQIREKSLMRLRQIIDR